FDVSPEGEGIGDDSETNQKLARSYGINPVQIRQFEQDEMKFKNAYMGLVIIHGDIIEKIPTITSTEGLEYELTTAIQKLNNKISTLLSLKEKIQIKLFMSSSLKAVAPFMGLKELPNLPDNMEKAVENANSKNFDKLEFKYLDPSTDASLGQELKKYSLMNLKWPALAEGKIPPGSGYIGMVMEYLDKKAEIPILNVMRIPIIGTRYELVNMENLDEIINENVETLIDINENIGYLADHGTPGLMGGSPMNPMAQQNNALSNFNSLITRNYSFKQVNLKEEAIPESLNCLVIAGPTEKFSDYELFKIDQYLMRGKNLAIFLDSFQEVMPPQNRQSFAFNQGPNYVPLNTGLEKLLDHYGIRIKKSYVMDENCYKQVLPKQYGGGERDIYFAPIIQNRFINDDLKFMKNIKGLVAMKVSPMVLDEEKIKNKGITTHKLIASSEKSWEMKGRINLNPMFLKPPASDDEKESLAISYLLEGEFPSYFDGKPIPEKEVKEETEDKDITDVGPKDTEKKEPGTDLSQIERQGEFIAKSRNARIFLLSSAEMLRNNVLDQEGKGPNTTFIMNVIDSLNNRDEIAVMRSKEQRFNPLEPTEAFAKMSIKSFNIAGLPVLVVLFGLFVWLKRHSRRKNIQMMFQK
ncbi:MAG: ABC transporter permease, partial [Desulfobacteraceae bacterium]|nr:ABC transporter permease [Desulfobacteraceae bacterium]